MIVFRLPTTKGPADFLKTTGRKLPFICHGSRVLINPLMESPRVAMDPGFCIATLFTESGLRQNGISPERLRSATTEPRQGQLPMSASDDNPNPYAPPASSSVATDQRHRSRVRRIPVVLIVAMIPFAAFACVLVQSSPMDRQIGFCMLAITGYILIGTVFSLFRGSSLSPILFSAAVFQALMIWHSIRNYGIPHLKGTMLLTGIVALPAGVGLFYLLKDRHNSQKPQASSSNTML